MKEEPKIQLKTVIATLTRCCFMCDTMAKQAFIDTIIGYDHVPDKVRPNVIQEETDIPEEADEEDPYEEPHYNDVLSAARHFMISIFVCFLNPNNDKKKQYLDFINKEWTTEENQRKVYNQILGKTGLGTMAYNMVMIYDEFAGDTDLVNERALYKKSAEDVPVSFKVPAEYTLYFIAWLAIQRFRFQLNIDFRGKPLPDVCKNRLCYVLFDTIASLRTSESDKTFNDKMKYITNEYKSKSRRQIIYDACGSKILYRHVYFFIDEFYKEYFLQDCQEEDSFFSNNPHLYDDEELEQLRKENEQLAKWNEDMKKRMQGIVNLATAQAGTDLPLASLTPPTPKALENKEDQESQKTLFSLVTKGKEGVFRKMMDELSPYLVKTESEHYRYEDRCQFSFHQKRGTVTKVCGILARYTRADLFDCDYSSLATYISSHTNLKGSVKTIRKMLYQKKSGPLSSPR